MYFVDYTGRRYGNLVVLQRGSRNEKRKLYSWICKCDCGNIKEIIGADLRNGNTLSCGCLSSRTSEHNATKTHGLSKSLIYNVYRSMLDRCNNESTKSYKDYGARGISVCNEWLTFEGFYSDMGESYKQGLTIERINYDGNYCKDNCIWIPKRDQGLNKRNNKMVTYNGELVALVKICREKNLNCKTIKHRLNRGWDIEKALSTPIKSLVQK
jgi:hypothetical protein